MLFVLGPAYDSQAAMPQGGSSQVMQQDAQRALPLSKLTPKGRELADRVLGDVTVFRRLPTQVIESDHEMYTFLVEHPDLVINIWEVMGLTKVVMNRIGPNSFRLNDGNGTTGDIHYLYRSPGHTLVYCEGTYTGSLMPRAIRGRCLLSLRSAGVRDADGDGRASFPHTLVVAEEANKLHKAGVSLQVGAHGQREGLGAHWEMWMMGLGGMSSLEAIRTATLTAAELLDMEGRIGEMKAGAFADIIAVKGDPLSDVRMLQQVPWVMKGGVVEKSPR